MTKIKLTNPPDLSHLVPYTGATDNVDLGAHTLTATSVIETTPTLLKLDQTTPQSVINGSPIMEGIQFDTTPSTTNVAEGLLRWNATDGTLDLGMSGGDITLQVGQEMFQKVRNVSGSTILNGKPVYTSGRTGNRPNIYLAKGDAESTSSVIGVTTQDILSPADGFVTTMGYVRGIKTDYTGAGIWGTTWASGDKLWVSKAVAGQLTNVEPTAPHHSDIVATVEIVHQNLGSILVNIDRHKTLEELSDVDGSAPDTTGDLLSYNAVTSVWDRNTYNITDYVATADLVDSTVDSAGCEMVGIDSLSGATYKTQCDFNSSFGSAGRKTGGEITDATGGYVAVAGGTGFIKATDDDNATLISFDFPAPANIAIPAGSTRYIGVEYNGGTPRVVARTSFNWNKDSEFSLGRVISESINGTESLHIISNPWWVTDGITNVIERIRAMGRLQRDVNEGGLMLSVTGTRNIAVTAGTIWSNLNEFAIDAIDTAVTGTVEYYWYKAGSGWQDSDATAYSATQYNDPTQATLQNLGSGKYYNTWVYAEADDLEIALIYGQADYSTQAAAAAVQAPSLLPAHIQQNGILIGRIIARQGTTAPILVQSAFTTTMGTATAINHNALAGLQGGAAGEYLHLTSAEYTGLSGLTASEIVGTDASGNLASLPVATYPSLTELSYVKGVTSAIQTQIGTKQPQLNGTGFVKASGTTISYDNSTYLTSLSGALLATGATTGATSQAQIFTNGVTLSNLTATRIPFAGVAGLIGDSANLTFSGTDLYVSGKIGIGKAPTVSLDIAQGQVNIAATSSTTVYGFDCASTSLANNLMLRFGAIVGVANGFTAIQDASSNVVFGIDPGTSGKTYVYRGLFGVGTNIPAAKVDIVNPSGDYGITKPLIRLGYHTDEFFRVYLDSSYNTVFDTANSPSGKNIIMCPSAGGVAIGSTTAPTLALEVTGSSKVTGAFGIGTSPTVGKLHISGAQGDFIYMSDGTSAGTFSTYASKAIAFRANTTGTAVGFFNQALSGGLFIEERTSSNVLATNEMGACLPTGWTFAVQHGTTPGTTVRLSIGADGLVSMPIGLGLGATPSTSYVLNAAKTFAINTGGGFGMRFVPTLASTADGDASMYGINIYPTVAGNGYDTNIICGQYIEPNINHTAGAVTATVYGQVFAGYCPATSAGTVTNWMQNRIGDIAKHASSTETIGTLYGLYIDQQTKGGTNYQIYSVAGNMYFGAGNIVTDTTTGMKIGTATGQKLAFWNSTPVVQQVLATGAGKTVDNVISLLQTLGLCKQS